MTASSPKVVTTTSSHSINSSNKVYQYKLVLLGESAVGKSSLVLRFVKNIFAEHQESTIGAAFLTQTISSSDGSGDVLKFEIWDTAGQERYNSLAPMYYRGAHGAIIVYDITKYESFERAKKWTMELQRNATPNIVIALVGNKLDLQSTNRKVSYQEAYRYAEENNLLCFETSARTGECVKEVFEALGEKLPRTEQQVQVPRLAGSASRSTIDFGRASAIRDNKSCC